MSGLAGDEWMKLTFRCGEKTSQKSHWPEKVKRKDKQWSTNKWDNRDTSEKYLCATAYEVGVSYLSTRTITSRLCRVWNNWVSLNSTLGHSESSSLSSECCQGAFGSSCPVLNDSWRNLSPLAAGRFLWCNSWIFAKVHPWFYRKHSSHYFPH